jgi:hypothetical protein
VESNKDRQYRTDHDRCWYTVEVKLALLAHRPAARSGSHTSDNGKRSVFKTRSPYGLPGAGAAARPYGWLVAVARYASSLAAVYASLYALPMHYGAE